MFKSSFVELEQGLEKKKKSNNNKLQEHFKYTQRSFFFIFHLLSLSRSLSIFFFFVALHLLFIYFWLLLHTTERNYVSSSFWKDNIHGMCIMSDIRRSGKMTWLVNEWIYSYMFYNRVWVFELASTTLWKKFIFTHTYQHQQHTSYVKKNPS